MSLTESLLERSFVYRMWQAPFAEQKFAPVLAHNDLAKVRHVLDVACGPGTNTHHFRDTDYLGIDLNEKYIREARARHQRNFVVADVCAYHSSPTEPFDFILVNSFLHHLRDPDVANILSHLRTLLSEDGHIHLLELVLPPDKSIARVLARWDRGKHARPLDEWKNTLSLYFEPVVAETYPLTCFGTVLWNMIYFKGKARASSGPELL